MIEKIRSRIRTDLEWRDFEFLCGVLLSWCGFVSLVTKGRGDGGIDVIARKGPIQSPTELRLIQVKHTSQEGKTGKREIEQWLDTSQVREAICAAHKVANSVSVGYYTAGEGTGGAKEWAHCPNVDLQDVNDLSQSLVRFKPEYEKMNLERLFDIQAHKKRKEVSEVGSVEDVLPVKSGVHCIVDERGYVNLNKSDYGKKVNIYLPNWTVLKEETCVPQDGSIYMGNAFRAVNIGGELRKVRAWVEYTGNWCDTRDGVND